MPAFACFTDHGGSRLCWLRANAEPVVDAFEVDINDVRLVHRIERSELLFVATITRHALVSSNESIERSLLGTVTLKSEPYGHGFEIERNGVDETCSPQARRTVPDWKRWC